MHLWLAPFTPGAHHLVYLEFDNVQTIAMIRIWVSCTFIYTLLGTYVNV